MIKNKLDRLIFEETASMLGLSDVDAYMHFQNVAALEEDETFKVPDKPEAMNVDMEQEIGSNGAEVISTPNHHHHQPLDNLPIEYSGEDKNGSSEILPNSNAVEKDQIHDIELPYNDQGDDSIPTDDCEEIENCDKKFGSEEHKNVPMNASNSEMELQIKTEFDSNVEEKSVEKENILEKDNELRPEKAVEISEENLSETKVQKRNEKQFEYEKNHDVSHVCKFCDRSFDSHRLFLNHLFSLHLYDKVKEKYFKAYKDLKGKCILCEKKNGNLNEYLLHIGVSHSQVLSFVEEDLSTSSEIIDKTCSLEKDVADKMDGKPDDKMDIEINEPNMKEGKKDKCEPILKGESNKNGVENENQVTNKCSSAKDSIESQGVTDSRQEIHCEYCEKKFKYRKMLMKHLNKGHSKLIEIVKRKYSKEFHNKNKCCTMCELSMSSMEDFTQHVLLEHSEFMKVCENTPNTENSQQEIKKVNSPKPTDQPELMAGLSEDSDTNVNEKSACAESNQVVNVKNETSTLDKVTCIHCDKSFDNSNSIRTHLAFKHFGKTFKDIVSEDEKKCVICSLAFGSQNSVIVHRVREHDELFEMIPPKFAKQIKQLKKTSLEKKTVRVEKSKGAKKEMKSTANSIVVNTSQMKCPNCDKHLSNKYDYLNHNMFSHYIDETKRRFEQEFIKNHKKCDMCQFKAPSLYKYIRHKGSGPHYLAYEFLPKNVIDILEDFLKLRKKSSSFKSPSALSNSVDTKADLKSKLTNNPISKDLNDKIESSGNSTTKDTVNGESPQVYKRLHSNDTDREQVTSSFKNIESVAKSEEHVEKESAIKSTVDVDQERNISVNSGNVECSYCDKRFKYRRSLTKHFAKSHVSLCESLKGKYSIQFHDNNGQCPFCQEDENNVDNLIYHILLEHFENVECSKDSNTSSNDQAEHVKDEVFAGKEIVDEKANASKDHMQMDKNDDVPPVSVNHKEKLKRKICSICDKKFDTVKTLNIHLFQSHLKDELKEKLIPFHETNAGFCEACDKTMPNIDAYVMHMGIIHDQVSLLLVDKNFQNQQVSDVKATDAKMIAPEVNEMNAGLRMEDVTPNDDEIQNSGKSETEHISLNEKGSQTRQPIEDGECSKNSKATKDNSTVDKSKCMELPEQSNENNEGSRKRKRDMEPEIAEKRSKLECPTCKEQFSVKAKFINHQISAHYRSEFKKFETEYKKNDGQCSECSFQAFNSPQFIKHVSMTHNEMFPKIIIDMLKDFDANEKYEENRDQIQCTLCSRILSTQYEALRHLARSHYRSKLKEFFNPNLSKKCPICDKVFSDNTTAIEHIALVHKKLYDICDQEMLKRLGKSDQVPPKENEYIRTRSDVKYICNMCDFTCNGHSSLLWHLVKAHYRENLKAEFEKITDKTCLYCKREFPGRSKTIEHIGVIHKKVMKYCNAELLKQLNQTVDDLGDNSEKQHLQSETAEDTSTAKSDSTCDVSLGVVDQVASMDNESKETDSESNENEKKRKSDTQCDLVEKESKIKKKESDLLICPECGKEFEGPAKFVFHLLGTHYKIEFYQRFHDDFKKNGGFCVFCPFKAETSQFYIRHMGITHKMANEVLPKTIVDKLNTFETWKNSYDFTVSKIQSMQTQEKNPTTIECNICSTSYSTVKSILKHLMRSHFGDRIRKDFPVLDDKKCTICDKGFTEIGSVHEHIAIVHKKVLNYCDNDLLKRLDNFHVKVTSKVNEKDNSCLTNEESKNSDIGLIFPQISKTPKNSKKIEEEKNKDVSADLVSSSVANYNDSKNIDISSDNKHSYCDTSKDTTTTKSESIMNFSSEIDKSASKINPRSSDTEGNISTEKKSLTCSNSIDNNGIKCLTCENVFTTRTEYARHQIFIHYRDQFTKRFEPEYKENKQCRFCSYKPDIIFKYIRHMGIVHNAIEEILPNSVIEVLNKFKTTRKRPKVDQGPISKVLKAAQEKDKELAEEKKDKEGGESEDVFDDVKDTNSDVPNTDNNDVDVKDSESGFKESNSVVNKSSDHENSFSALGIDFDKYTLSDDENEADHSLNSQECNKGSNQPDKSDDDSDEKARKELLKDHVAPFNKSVIVDQENAPESDFDLSISSSESVAEKLKNQNLDNFDFTPNGFLKLNFVRDNETKFKKEKDALPINEVKENLDIFSENVEESTEYSDIVNCTMCDFETKSSYAFLLHLTRKHFAKDIRLNFLSNADDKLSCSFCTLRFKWSGHLIDHIGCVHKQVSRFANANLKQILRSRDLDQYDPFPEFDIMPDANDEGQRFSEKSESEKTIASPMRNETKVLEDEKEDQTKENESRSHEKEEDFGNKDDSELELALSSYFNGNLENSNNSDNKGSDQKKSEVNSEMVSTARSSKFEDPRNQHLRPPIHDHSDTTMVSPSGEKIGKDLTKEDSTGSSGVNTRKDATFSSEEKTRKVSTDSGCSSTSSADESKSFPSFGIITLQPVNGNAKLFSDDSDSD